MELASITTEMLYMNLLKEVTQCYGSFFYKAISEYFRNEGFKAVKLFCEPRSSERFWRKMGLRKFPDCGQTEHELTYYWILVDTASITYISNADKIELQGC